MRILVLLLAFVAATPVFAAPPVAPMPAPPKEVVITANATNRAIELLIPLLKDQVKPEDYFTADFLKAVPVDQFNMIKSSIITQFGQPQEVSEIKKTGDFYAEVKISFERAVGTFKINVEENRPFKTNGLLATDFVQKNDSIEKVRKEFDALSGKAGFAIQKLEKYGEIQTIAEKNAAQQFATGSVFKLYILAQLASEIEAGERKWSDMVPLTHRSFSSAKTKDIAPNTLVSLKDLAAWMISVSDNGATDTLLHLLGRTKVEQKLALIGHSAPNKILPFLSTVEAFALKAPGNKKMRNRFLRASEKKQRALLRTDAKMLQYDKIDLNTFKPGIPMYIDSIEWFANANDLARIMDNLRRGGSQQALDIMAINPGVSPASAKKWDYLGYKGGSEVGVISMSFLGKTKEGQWKVISGSWNDTTKAVDETTFILLMSRLVDLAAD